MGLTPRHTAALAGLLLGTAAVAQPPPPPGLPQPRITAALPAGAKAGTTVEVAVTGTDLDAPLGLVFSHPGITAEAVRTPEPKPDPKKKPAAKKAAPTPATAAFKVSVAAGVPAGWYDVRVSNKWGVSSPRAFVVGTRPEVNEAEPNNDVPEAQRITLGTVVNGVIAAPTDVDYTVFAGKAGERVTLTCQSGAIDGRARPLVELFTADGRRVAGGRASVDGDVTVEATLPAAGDYYVRVCEFAYQTGGADHFYRLTVGGDPGRSGHIPPAMAFHDGVVSTLPVHAEKDGPNDTAAAAEVIPVPCEVVGRFGRPGDRDVFKFAAKKGEPLVLELLAERLGGPNDVFLRVRDSAGKDLLGDLDDDQDSLHPTGFVSRSSDPPATRFTPPADGTYFAVVGAHDSSTVFGPRAAYRLRVRRPTPDFRAVVMARSKTQPDAPVLRAGGTTSVDVLVHRIDGFAGPVTLTAADLPPGVTAKPGLVGTGQRYGTLVLSAAATVKEFTGPVRVVCEAQADAGTLIRDARPASVTWGCRRTCRTCRPSAGWTGNWCWRSARTRPPSG